MINYNEFIKYFGSLNFLLFATARIKIKTKIYIHNLFDQSKVDMRYKKFDQKITGLINFS